MRKKKELKDSNKSGTSAQVVEKAQKALDQYQFMVWMDVFIQPREGRTNINIKTKKTLEDESEDRDEQVVGEDSTNEVEKSRELSDKDEEDEDKNIEKELIIPCEKQKRKGEFKAQQKILYLKK